MNATERIRAALERTEAARHLSEGPPAGAASPDLPTPEPVESTLRLVSTGDAARVAEELSSRGPAETVEFLRSSLGVPARTPAPPAPVPVPEPGSEAATEVPLWAAEAPAKPKRLSWIWIAVAAGLVVIALAAVMFRNVWAPGQPAPAPLNALQLAVESEDNGLISLRWNGQSVPVAQARDGRLSILENQKTPRTVALSAAQLGAGHLFYESSSDRVEFQLDVVEKSGAVVHESAMAARKPAPTVSASAAPQTPAAQNPAGQPPVVETPKPVQPAPRAFTPPPAPVARDRAGEGRVILMEPAPAIAGGPAVSSVANIILPPQAAAPPQSAPATSRPAAQRIQVGGRLQSALLLRKVDPTYPPLARQMRIQGLVRFQAIIGKEGEVKDLRFVSGPRVLQQAATEAVKRWVYRPTLLDGRPVEVSTQIDLNFSLGN